MRQLPNADKPQPAAGPAPEPQPRLIDWVWLFTGLRGRLDLVTYRFALCLVLSIVAIAAHWTHGSPGAGSEPMPLLLAFTDTVVAVPAAFALFALAVKRCHDMDWHGATALMIFVPIAGLAFLFVLLCGQHGTTGPNHYGPDPKARPSTDRQFTLLRGGRE
jgi:uncharacterized membrane protein YhaH (DUF805 family)